MIMMETTESGPHYIFDYEYSFTNNPEYIEAMYEYFGKG